MIALLIAKPKGALLFEPIRLLPDLLRLLRRLATDRGMPLGVRIRLAMIIAYPAIPIDATCGGWTLPVLTSSGLLPQKVVLVAQ